MLFFAESVGARKRFDGRAPSKTYVFLHRASDVIVFSMIDDETSYNFLDFFISLQRGPRKQRFGRRKRGASMA